MCVFFDFELCSPIFISTVRQSECHLGEGDGLQNDAGSLFRRITQYTKY